MAIGKWRFVIQLSVNKQIQQTPANLDLTELRTTVSVLIFMENAKWIAKMDGSIMHFTRSSCRWHFSVLIFAGTPLKVIQNKYRNHTAIEMFSRPITDDARGMELAFANTLIQVNLHKEKSVLHINEQYS